MSKTTVLVTRPAHQAQSLCEKLRAVGVHPLLFPTLEITEPSDPQIILTTLQSFDTFQIAIFTSANAVQKVAPLIKKRNDALKIIAIGQGTARSLKEHHLWVDACPSSSSSEALLELPLLQHVSGQHIIIFKGEGGRDLLAPALRKREAIVTESSVYRRIKPIFNKDTFLSDAYNQIDVITSTSYEGLKNLLEMVGKDATKKLLQRPLVVISDRMVTLAKNLGFKYILLARNASDDAIVARIKEREI